VDKEKHKIESLVNASDLFFFDSRLQLSDKAAILEWYNSLSVQYRGYVGILRQEAIEEERFFAQGGL
jgi:hypothetical protein